jgi:hypothetical protein
MHSQRIRGARVCRVAQVNSYGPGPCGTAAGAAPCDVVAGAAAPAGAASSRRDPSVRLSSPRTPSPSKSVRAMGAIASTSCAGITQCDVASIRSVGERDSQLSVIRCRTMVQTVGVLAQQPGGHFAHNQPARRRA